jgi:glycosyltransferase involved in cell wall biosynthesis
MTVTTHSLVLETHNLEGGDGDVATGLERLLAHLTEQTYPLGKLADLVITHRGIDEPGRSRCEKAAGVPIKWVRLDESAGYYDAKNRGFEVATGDIVAFGDADCWPDPPWLESLFVPFVNAAVKAVAGRTTYRRDLLGTALSTIDFMYFPSTFGKGYTRNFYANNVAFRRKTFAKHHYGEHAMYRGHCAVLGIDLHNARIPIVFEPNARTIHRFPDSVGELLKLRLLRGRDTYEITPTLGRTIMERDLPRLGPVVPLGVVGIRYGFSLSSINKQQMPEARGLKWLAVAGVTAALSAVDGLGALAGGLRLMKGEHHQALSYHGEDEKLAA